jgi:AcrR family transcriptional regulator
MGHTQAFGGETPQTLSPTARRLVDAARALLARDGFNGLTVDAVAREAGEYRDAVRYHFGSKAGLIAAVVDSLAHDQSVESYAATTTLPSGPARVHELVAGDLRLTGDVRSFQDFYELLPHVLRDDDLRAKVAALYGWYRDLYVRGFSERPDAAQRELLERHASLMVAVIDGLAVQKALDPAGCDLGALFDLWEAMLRRSLEELLGS